MDIMAHSNAVVENLAQNIHDARDRRGLTQAELAKLSGVPRSTISGVETGEGNPTIHVISALAAALRIPIEELLCAPRVASQLFAAGTLPVRRRGGVTVQKLLPHHIPGMEIDRISLGCNGRLTGVPHRPGTHEYLYCERGKLTLRVAGQKLDLRPGDVAAFPSDQRHSYQSRGKGIAVGFSVVTLSPIGDG